MGWMSERKTKGESDGSSPSALSRKPVDEISRMNLAIESIEAPVLEPIRAHCLRVAAWAGELASTIGLSDSDRNLVEQAALAHHVPEVLVDDQARKRLLAEMHLEASGEQPLVTDEVQAVLETLWGRRPIANPAMGKIVAVLEISDDFDQHFESEPLFDLDAEDQCANSSVEAMMTYLQVTSRADVSRVIERLPVFPRAAREVVRQVSNSEAGPRELETVAALDPVLAGRLIQTANSAYYSPRQPIGTVFHAVSYIGTEAARRVLLAAAIRSNFSSPQSHRIWNHSLDVAQAAEWIAAHSKVRIDPAQAFLAGLIHDIGRLAFAIMPVAFQDRFQRLTDGGCPAVEVEMCLSGRSHSEVGAETLTQWKFPLEIVEAVRWHHRPERSSLPLASLLYLAEFAAEAQEDLPSFVRMNAATGVAGIALDSLLDIRQENAESLSSLKFAA
jgi:putative nucleotidyltransferase with HDIG domain